MCELSHTVTKVETQQQPSPAGELHAHTTHAAHLQAILLGVHHSASLGLFGAGIIFVVDPAC